MDYVFMTDSDSDLPYRLKVACDIPVVYMPYSLDGKEYYDDLGQSIDHKTYYDRMRAGAVPVTASLNEAAYEEIFEPIFAAGQDILFIAFSSKMSSTIVAMRNTLARLQTKYPERKYRVVDTLSISAPQAILVLKAHRLYKAGKSMDEVADWVEANRMRTQAWVTVDDLKYLKRGGRIKPVAAAMGTMLNIKPIIIESRDGLMVSVDKVRGRHKALAYLAEKTAENIDDPKEAETIIIHADAPEDAMLLKERVQALIPAIGEIAIENVGPVIGAHCGPGTLAICFFGKERPQ
ncbi:MAG: DegV family protein [Clostridia bacterium]|nr:DegV family protein [Clostridia bacterium]